MWDFDHEPARRRLRERYDLATMMPSQCAARLEEGSADLGLVPVAALATVPGLLVAPGCVIASKGAIRSILLVVKSSIGRDGVRTVAADTSSRASLAYAQILFRHYWHNPARFFQHPPDLDRMLESGDAALLIGDPALLALQDRDARHQRTGELLDYIDLGLEWHAATGLPWVSAVWAVRADSVNGNNALRGQIVADLSSSREHGLTHRDDLIKEWAARLPIPASTIRAYLYENIHYVLDDACLAGLRHFFALGAECGVLPAAPPLRMLAG